MGDAAPENLASRYRQVHRFVRRRSGSDMAADDLTQQVFVEALVALRGSIGQDHLGLLFTIARRRLIDRLRADTRTLVPLEEAEGVAASHEYSADLSRAIAEAIRRLEPPQKQVVVLKLLRGLSFAEVAGVLGCSEAACKMRLRRALEHLRDELERKGFAP
jgi:RNA polymerase sigma factor (sigma-70 family)